MAKKPNSEKPNANPDDVAGCFAEYSQMQGEMSRIKQRIATMLKRYENMGVDGNAVKYAYAQSHKENPEHKHKKRTEYLVILGLIGVDEEGQSNFSAALDVAKPSTEIASKLALARAHTDGYNSGRHGGKIENNPFNAGTETFVKWLEGFHDGHADRIAHNPDADKVTEATPRKRGRKPKDNQSQPADLPDASDLDG